MPRVAGHVAVTFQDQSAALGQIPGQVLAAAAGSKKFVAVGGEDPEQGIVAGSDRHPTVPLVIRALIEDVFALPSAHVAAGEGILSDGAEAVGQVDGAEAAAVAEAAARDGSKPIGQLHPGEPRTAGKSRGAEAVQALRNAELSQLRTAGEGRGTEGADAVFQRQACDQIPVIRPGDLRRGVIVHGAGARNGQHPGGVQGPEEGVAALTLVDHGACEHQLRVQQRLVSGLDAVLLQVLPLTHAAVIDHPAQGFAAGKGVLPHKLHGLGDGDAVQPCQIPEGVCPDACAAGGQLHGAELPEAPEGVAAHALHPGPEDHGLDPVPVRGPGGGAVAGGGVIVHVPAAGDGEQAALGIKDPGEGPGGAGFGLRRGKQQAGLPGGVVDAQTGSAVELGGVAGEGVLTGGQKDRDVPVSVGDQILALHALTGPVLNAQHTVGHPVGQVAVPDELLRVQQGKLGQAVVPAVHGGDRQPVLPVGAAAEAALQIVEGIVERSQRLRFSDYSVIDKLDEPKTRTQLHAEFLRKLNGDVDTFLTVVDLRPIRCRG